MDSYAIARAESRIRQLEFEIERLKHDVERRDSNARSERTNSESTLYFWLWLIAMWTCSLFLLALAVGKKG